LRNTNHIVHQKAVLLQLHRAVLLCCLQILRRFLINYQYNAVGNRLSSIYEHPPSVNETTIYGYDGENRLTGVQITQGSNVKQLTFAYDPFGRRIKKTVSPSGGGSGEETTNYVYDGQNIILEYDQAGIITTRYTHWPNIDEPLSIEITGATAFTPYYYHADGLGSITALSNATGNIVQRYEYDSFGNQTITTNGNIKQPFTFTGREYDTETGMYFYRARYYDPKAGRFVTKDPIGFKGGDVNLYAYVSNDPINRIDPRGLDGIYINYNWYPVNTGYGFSLPLGHGAVIAVNPDTGTTKYFEYGRYDSNFGQVKQRTVPDLDMVDGKPTTESLQSLYGYISKNYGKNSTVDPGWPPKIPHLWPLENPPPNGCF
jgi:RHS repeat-associated protein